MLTSLAKAKKPDPVIFFLALVLSLFGLVMVYNASVVEAFALFRDKYYFLKLQALWLGIGLVFLALASFIPLLWVKKFAPLIFFFSLLLLVLVLVPGLGQTAMGARRWLSLAGFSLQPSELTKLSLSLYFSAWLVKKQPFWLYLVVLLLILILIMLQPDLGTAIVIVFSSILVYYASGANWLHLFLAGLLVGAGGLGLILSSSYRKARLLTFFDPTRDPLGSSYHIRQALITIGSGGLFGLGLGQSRQKYQFLPQVTTDSIFAVIAEEVGFIGASLVVISLFAFVWRGFQLARHANDEFSRLLAIALTGWIATQIVINLSAMLALLPLTGVPLPFISYGGSSLIVTLTAVGLLLNISRRQINPKKTRQ